MAAGDVANQGKTAFVQKYFASNPDGNLDTVNKAWTAEGNEGSLSESLVGKVRAKLGLTARKKVDEPRPTATPTRPKPKDRPKARKAAKPVGGSAPLATGSHTPSGTIAEDHEDDDILDELEEGIDELIQRIRELGGRPDVVKALRRARRLLVRSHLG